MDTTTAFQLVRQALVTIDTLQPEDGEYRATITGTRLTVRHADHTGMSVTFQHVSGGYMRVVTRQTGTLVDDETVIPVTTLSHLTDYLRALVVEVLR